MWGSTLTEPYGVGLGFRQIIKGTSPAAGSSFTLAVDPRYVTRILTCLFTLSTDANAANRYVTVEALDGNGNSFAAEAAGVVVTANTTSQRFAGSVTRGVAEWAANTDVLFPLWRHMLKGGETVKINVAAIQAGDTLTAITFAVEQYPVNREVVPHDEALHFVQGKTLEVIVE